MSLDMLSAEYQGQDDLGEELSYEAIMEHDISTTGQENLDDITFDVPHDLATGDGAVNAAEMDGEGDAVGYDQELGPDIALPDESGLDLEALDSNNDAAVGSPTPQIAEAGTAGVLEDDGTHMGLDEVSARSPVATHSTGNDDFAPEIDYDGNDEAALDGDQDSPHNQQSADVDFGHAAGEADYEDEQEQVQEQEPAESTDVLSRASDPDPDPGQDQDHTASTSEIANGSINRVEEIEVDAVGDHVEDHDLGLEPDTDHTHVSTPEHVEDVEVEAYEEVDSASHSQQDHSDNEDDVEYMEVSHPDISMEAFSSRPDVRIQYRGNIYSVFSTSKLDDPYSYFFSDVEPLDYPLSQFLAGLREVLSEELTADEELLIRIEGLGLEFSETMDKSCLDRTTFGSIVELHDRLVKGDDQSFESQGLLVFLLTRPHFMRRLDTLLDGANIGEGLSAYQISYPEYLTRDFPARDTGKPHLAGRNAVVDNDGVDGQYDSDFQDDGVDGLDEEGDVASPSSPKHAIEPSDWLGPQNDDENNEDNSGNSADQVIDETREYTSVQSTRSGSARASSEGTEPRGASEQPLEGNPSQMEEYEDVESEILLDHADHILEQADAESLGHAEPGVPESGNYDPSSYAEHSDDAGSQQRGSSHASGSAELGLLISDQDEGGQDITITAEDGSNEVDEDAIEIWDEPNHDVDDTAIDASEGHGALTSHSQQDAHESAAENVSDIHPNDWVTQDDLEPTVSEDHDDLKLPEEEVDVAEDDIAHGPDSEQTSASGTLDGDEIDLEDALEATASRAEEEQPRATSPDSGRNEQDDVDEIDWADNDEEVAVHDASISTSSISGKRGRADEGEELGGGHDVKRHRA